MFNESVLYSTQRCACIFNVALFSHFRQKLNRGYSQGSDYIDFEPTLFSIFPHADSLEIEDCLL